MRISDWSSDVCSSDLTARNLHLGTHGLIGVRHETQASRPRPLRTAPAAGRRHPSCRVVSAQRPAPDGRQQRSEEHTSELQSLMRTSYAVFFLKNKTTNKNEYTIYRQHQPLTSHKQK